MALRRFALVALGLAASVHSFGWPSKDETTTTETLTRFVFTCPCETTSSISFGTAYPTTGVSPTDRPGSDSGEYGWQDWDTSASPSLGGPTWTSKTSAPLYSTRWSNFSTSRTSSWDTTAASPPWTSASVDVHETTTSSTTADNDAGLTSTTSMTTMTVTVTTSGSTTTLSADSSAPTAGQPFSLQVNTGGTRKHKRDILVVGFVNGALVLVSSPANAVAFVLTSNGVLMIFGTNMVVGFGGGSGTSALMIYSSASALPTTLVWSVSGGALVLPGAGFCVGAGNVMSVNVGTATDSSCAPVTPVADTASDSYNTAVANTVTPSPQTTTSTTPGGSSSTLVAATTTTTAIDTSSLTTRTATSGSPTTSPIDTSSLTTRTATTGPPTTTPIRSSSLSTTTVIASSTSNFTTAAYLTTRGTTSNGSPTTGTTTATMTEETTGPSCSIMPLDNQTAPNGTEYTEFFYSCHAAIPVSLGSSYSQITSGRGSFSSDPTAFLSQCVGEAEQLGASVWNYYQSSSDSAWHCGFWNGLAPDDGIFVDDPTVFTMNAMTVVVPGQASSTTSTSSSTRTASTTTTTGVMATVPANAPVCTPDSNYNDYVHCPNVYIYDTVQPCQCFNRVQGGQNMCAYDFYYDEPCMWDSDCAAYGPWSYCVTAAFAGAPQGWCTSNSTSYTCLNGGYQPDPPSSSTTSTTSIRFATTSTTTSSVTSTTSSAPCVATSASVGDTVTATGGDVWINFFSSGCGLSLDWQSLDFNNLYVYQRADYTFEAALLECANIADNDGSPVFEFETDTRNNDRWVCLTLNNITDDPAQFQPYGGIADAYGWYLPSRMISTTTTASSSTRVATTPTNGWYLPSSILSTTPTTPSSTPVTTASTMTTTSMSESTTTATTASSTPTPTCNNGAIVTDKNGDSWETLCGQGNAYGWTIFSAYSNVATLSDCIVKCNADASCNAVSIEYRNAPDDNLCGFIYDTLQFEAYDFDTDTAIKISGDDARAQVIVPGASTTTTTGGTYSTATTYATLSSTTRQSASSTITTQSTASTTITSATSTTTTAGCTPSAIGPVTALYNTTQTFSNVFTGCGESMEAGSGGLGYFPNKVATSWEKSLNYQGWTLDGAVSRCAQFAIDNGGNAMEFHVDVDENWLCVGVDDLTVDSSSFFPDPDIVNVWGFVWENSCQNTPLADQTATDGTVFSAFYTGCSASLQGNTPGGLAYLNRVVSIDWLAPSYSGHTMEQAVQTCADQTVSQAGTMFEFYVDATDDSWYCIAVNDLATTTASFYPDASVGKVWGFAATQSTGVCTPSTLVPSVQTPNGTTYDAFYEACHVSLEGDAPGGPGNINIVFGFDNLPDDDGLYGGWTLETALDLCVKDTAAAGATVIEYYESSDNPPIRWCFGVNDVPASPDSFQGDGRVGRLWAFKLDESTLVPSTS